MKALKDEAHMLGAYRSAAIFIQRRQFRAVQPDAAFARFIEAGQQRQQCRFTRARGADDRNRFTRGDVQVDGGQDGQRSLRTANLLADVFCFEDRLRNAHVEV